MSFSFGAVERNTLEGKEEVRAVRRHTPTNRLAGGHSFSLINDFKQSAL